MKYSRIKRLVMASAITIAILGLPCHAMAGLFSLAPELNPDYDYPNQFDTSLLSPNLNQPLIWIPEVTKDFSLIETAFEKLNIEEVDLPEELEKALNERLMELLQQINDSNITKEDFTRILKNSESISKNGKFIGFLIKLDNAGRIQLEGITLEDIKLLGVEFKDLEEAEVEKAVITGYRTGKKSSDIGFVIQEYSKPQTVTVQSVDSEENSSDITENNVVELVAINTQPGTDASENPETVIIYTQSTDEETGETVRRRQEYNVSPGGSLSYNVEGPSFEVASANQSPRNETGKTPGSENSQAQASTGEGTGITLASADNPKPFTELVREETKTLLEMLQDTGVVLTGLFIEETNTNPEKSNIVVVGNVNISSETDKEEDSSSIFKVMLESSAGGKEGKTSIRFYDKNTQVTPVGLVEYKQTGQTLVGLTEGEGFNLETLFGSVSYASPEAKSLQEVALDLVALAVINSLGETEISQQDLRAKIRANLETEGIDFSNLPPQQLKIDVTKAENGNIEVNVAGITLTINRDGKVAHSS